MTAAAVAAAQGLQVLLIEKTEFVGGTTAWSGGTVWIPANARMREAALSDSRADAEAYLADTAPEDDNATMRETFLSRGPEAVRFGEGWAKPTGRANARPMTGSACPPFPGDSKRRWARR